MLAKKRAALVLAMVAALGGCEEPYAPDLAPRGEARFTMAGDTSGEFLADGRMNRRNPNAGTWAIGELVDDQGGQVLGVFAQQRREDNLWNAFILEWAGVQVGSVTCPVGSTAPCPIAAVLVLGTQPSSQDVEAEYGFARGTVTVTEVNEDRAVGTFSLTLSRLGATEDPVPTVQLNGSFNVPVNEARPD
ncbi:MAG TPA: hypothetical protein VFR37_04270 [Longimicrobium sp.]|nr:hypothetical protein [Longimicrobium sp.]